MNTTKTHNVFFFSYDMHSGSVYMNQRQRIDRVQVSILTPCCCWSPGRSGRRGATLFGRLSSTIHVVIQAALEEGEEWALAGYAPLQALELFRSQNWVSMLLFIYRLDQSIDKRYKTCTE